MKLAIRFILLKIYLPDWNNLCLNRIILTCIKRRDSFFRQTQTVFFKNVSVPLQIHKILLPLTILIQ